MTHDQLIVIERTAQRAFSAINTFADKEDKENLAKAGRILAEIRHCGAWLCDPEASPAMRADVIDRLVNFIAN